MATLNVGPGQDFSTIADAIAASSAGDTIYVQAGTYNDDFLGIYHDLTLQSVGGMAVMTADTAPPNGKAMIDEGGAGVNVAINGFDISGVSVPDQNGAAIRYEGGNLSLSQDYLHDNQEGLLAASDPNGTISIDGSEFAFNGDGSGYTHGIYVNHIGTLSVTNSYIHDTTEGHEIKSRAENTIISGNRIFDNQSTASYSIDLPNGGNATITDNLIEQGPNSDNPFVIAYGEEGQSNPGTDVSIAGNTIVNDQASRSDAALLNRTDLALPFTDNQVWGLPNLSNGPIDESGTTFLDDRPSLDTSSLSFIIGDGGSSSDGDTIDMTTSQDATINDFTGYALTDPAMLPDAASPAASSSQYYDPLGGSVGIPADSAWWPFPQA
jgi:hypothetical protein